MAKTKAEHGKVGEPFEIAVEIRPDDRLFLKQDWVSGEYGDKKIYIAPVINGTLLNINTGDHYYTMDVTQLLRKLVEREETKRGKS